MYTAFKSYLESLGLGAISRKLYLADLKRFFTYLDQDPTLNLVSSPQIYINYLNSLKSLTTSPSMLKRTLASLRQFGNFLHFTYDIANPTTRLTLSDTKTNLSNDSGLYKNYINLYTKHLKSQHLSTSTIKAYKSDITRYIDWMSTSIASTHDLQLTKPKYIKKYLNHLADSHGALSSTIARKTKSLTKFATWLTVFTQPPQTTDNSKTTEFVSSHASTEPIPDPYHTQSTSQQLAKQSHFSSPESITNSVKKINYRNLLSLAVLLIFASTLAIFLYRQFASDTRLTAAFPTTPVTPNRQLSFQGRLEDASGTPINASTNFVFKLFDADSGGTELYSTGTCSITPDTDGVFNTQIGDTCGTGIPSSVFSENADVWLEVTVGAEVLDPRQQIATVAYALNSETIQGFPISATVSAIKNTVVPMNEWGEIIMGEQSPKLTGVAGTLQISAPSLTLATTTGTSGNISLAPDGTGQINAYGNTTSTNFFNISNAQLTTGALITGTVANNNTGFDLLNLSSGASPTSKFSVDASGNTTIAGSTITLSGFNCTSNTNGGALTTNGSGVLQCSDDDGGGGGGSFTDLTSGTNTVATMVVGTGASLDFSGSGTINASTLLSGTWASPGAIGSTTANSGDFTTLDANSLTLTGNLNLTAPSNLIFGGTTHLGETTGPTDSGAYLIGVYDEFDNSNSLNVQAVLNDLDSAITTALSSSTLWTDAGTYLYPTSAETLGNSAIGGANKIAGLYLADSAPLAFGTDNDITFSFTGSTLGSVLTPGSMIGINTTSALATLDIRGSLGTIPVASISGNTSMSALIVDQSGSGDILTASSSGQTRFVVKSNGNVGIGVADPTSKLAIGGSSSTISNTSGNITIDSFGGSIVFGTDDDLIPTLGAGDADIGSASLPWDNIYGLNFGFGTGGGSFSLADNTSGALQIAEGANTYLDISTTNNIESFTLDLPTGGATSLTANLFNSNLAKTINLGTGTGADTINIGTGDTTADTINIGGLFTTSTNFTGVTNFAGGTTYFVDASGNAKFLDLQVADTANPGLTIGNGSIGFMLIGGSTISDNAGSLTLDSDTAQTIIADNLQINGNNLLDSGGTTRIGLGATTTLTNTTTTLSGTTTLTASSLATMTTASTLGISATTLNLGGSATLRGGTAASGTLTLESTSNATKGNIQFFSSSNTLDPSGNLIIAGDLRLNGNDIADSGGTTRIGLGATTTLTNTTTTLSGTTTLTASSLDTLTTSSSVNWGGATSLTFTADNALISGSDATNGNLSLQGTTSSTRTTSYLLLQPNGGNVGIGVSSPAHLLELADHTTAAGGIGFGTDVELYRSAANVLSLASGDSLNLVSGSLQVGSTDVINSSRFLRVADGNAVTPSLSFASDANNGIFLATTDQIGISTAGTEQVRIDDSGRVGIGAPPPTSSQLYVQGPYSTVTGGQGTLTLQDSTSMAAGVGAGIAFRAIVNGSGGSAGLGGIKVGKTNATDDNYASYMSLYTRGTGSMTEAIRIDNNQNVGVGRTNPSYRLDVLGTGTGIIARFNSTNTTGCTLATGGTITCTSDIRLKENIQNLDYGLDTILALDPVSFDWKNQPNPHRSLGFIAQAVEAIVPELVVTDPDTGYKQLNSVAMIPILTKSITQLNSKIDSLPNPNTFLANLQTFLVPEIKTNLISPLSVDEPIIVTSPLHLTPANLNPDLPTLVVEGEIEATTISARLAQLTEINTEIITARTIIADTITANSITGLDAKIATLSGISDSQFETITDRIKARLQALTTPDTPTAQDLPAPDLSDSALPLPATTSATPLASADIDFVTINEYLAVIGQATITTLDVTNTLYANHLTSKTGLLALGEQTLLIDSSGSVTINGDLVVSGKILASSATVESLAIEAESALGNLLAIYNESGQEVATIDASGSANLANLKTSMITIASSGTATDSSALSSLAGFAQSNATAGVSTLVSPGTEVTINSPHITPNSLIYLTPTGNTGNKVLFVKSKNSCTPSALDCTQNFTVGIDSPSPTDITFNWWIIALDQSDSGESVL